MSWLSTWANRRKLTIAASDIDANLTNFPVRIYLSSAAGQSSSDVTDIFSDLGEDSLKVALTTSDGTTQCNVEVAYWAGASNKANLWFKAPSVSSSSNTDFYLYWDASASDNTTYVGAVNSTAGSSVWNSDYKMVMHFGETSGSYLDSTGNSIDSTAVSVSSRTASGLVGPDSPDFAGSHSITLASASSWPVEKTLEVFSKTDSTASGYRPMLNHESGTNWFQIGRNATQGHFRWHSSDTNRRMDFGTIATGTWYHFAGVLDDTNYASATALAYIDGVQQNSVSSAGIPATTAASSWNIGKRGGEYWDGIIDEVRVSTTPRSVQWLRASNDTMRDSLNTFSATESGSFSTPTINAGHTVQSSANPLTNHSVDSPTHSEGDLIFIFAAIESNNGATMTAPSGFSSAYQNHATYLDQSRGSCWYKTASGSEPSSYTWTSDVAEGSASIAWSVSGHDGGIDSVSGSATGNGSSATALSVTTASDNALVMRCLHTDSDTLSHNTATGHTFVESVNPTGAVSISVQYEVQTTAGSTGNASIGMSAADEWGARTVSVAGEFVSAPAPTPVTPTYGPYTWDTLGSVDEGDWLFADPVGTGVQTNNTTRRWCWHDSSTTSSNVGPTSGQGGSPDGYLYTEASSPGAFNDVFTMEFDGDLDTVDNTLQVDWYTNQRGDNNNATCELQTNEGGAGWTTRATFGGSSDPNKVNTSGVQIWAARSVDLTSLVSHAQTRIRLTITFPASGTAWHNDYGIDNVTLTLTALSVPESQTHQMIL